MATPNQFRKKDDGDQPKRVDAHGNKIPDPQEELALIEKEIFDLKSAFEQYFAGLDRHSPIRRKDALAQRLRRLKETGNFRNTALKFRLEQTANKFGTYDRMWTRSIAEMEAGTSRRDSFRVKRAKAAPPPPTEKSNAAASGTTPAAAQKPAQTPSALSDGQVRALYEAMVTARQRTNESTDGLTYDALAKNLRRQVPELLQRYEAKAIDFKVVIKNGKAMLKAVPRK